MVKLDTAPAKSTYASPDAEPWPPSGQAWGAVVLLMAAFFVSYIDRSILSLLVEPIRLALGLSDTEIGFLHGAFGIFYTLATLPAGWIADRGNRMRLVGWGIACWSLMTGVCGLCSNFVQLFLARMGVAIGEATLTPAGPSVISDNFPSARRTLSMSLYGWGAGAGAAVALIAGGFVAGLISGQDIIDVPLLSSFVPWQFIFLTVGLPGLILSVFFFLAQEPKRREQVQMEGTFHELVDVMRSRGAVIVPLFVGICVYQIYAAALAGWLPAFFMRIHRWDMSDVGMKLGVTQLICGIVGALVGGAFAWFFWRCGRRDANLLTGAIFYGVMVIPALLATIVSSAFASVLLIGAAIGCMQAAGGANLSAIQEIIPNRLRARVTAIYYAIVGLVGMTLGPIMIGLMNDHVFAGAQGIGKSMSLMALMTLPVRTLCIFIAARRRVYLEWATR